MSDDHQCTVAAEAADLKAPLSANRSAPRKKKRTDEQQAARQALRAAKLARKQQEAAAQRQQKAAQLKARQADERQERAADDEHDDAEQALDGSCAAIHGNFHNYYAFNAVSERLQFITQDFIQHVARRTTPLAAPPLAPAAAEGCEPHLQLPSCSCPSSDHSLPAVFARPEPCDRAEDAVYVCDLGCNVGELTVELVQRLSDALADERPVVAVGIDIDGELIRRARHKCAQPSIDDYTLSMTQQPAQQAARAYVSFYQANLLCSATFASLQSVHPSRSTAAPPPFHLVTCFSLLMWLHLCYGSAALCHFLSALCLLASHLLIELQGWRHYRSAVERRRRSGLDEGVWHWASIEEEWRGRGGQAVRERVVDVLQAGGMREVAVLGKTKWGREVIWFSRAANNEAVKS